MPRKPDHIADDTQTAPDTAPVLIDHMVIINGRDFTIRASDGEDLEAKIAAIRATL